MKDGIIPVLDQWQPCATPGDAVLIGAYARLKPLDWSRHREGLYAAVCGDANRDLWHYMPVGPFTDGPAAFESAFTRIASDWQVMVIHDAVTGKIVGMASYMRLREAHGSCEIGCVAFGPDLRRTRAATDAVYLIAAHVFDDLGYRRLEWKCDTTNEASMRAAARFGFVAEGVFRQDMVVKGRNRDSAWFSITDGGWPDCKAAFRLWLHPDNFTADGKQKTRLEDIRAAL